MFESTPVLRKHLLLGTDGRDALTPLLANIFGDHSIESGSKSKDTEATTGLCKLDKMKLFYGHWSSALRVQIFDSPYFMQSFPIRGTSETVNNGIARTSSPSKGAHVRTWRSNVLADGKFRELRHVVRSRNAFENRLDAHRFARPQATEAGPCKFRRAARGAIVARPRQVAGRGTGRGRFRSLHRWWLRNSNRRSWWRFSAAPTTITAAFSMVGRPARRRGKFGEWRNISKRIGISQYPSKRSQSSRTRAREAYFIHSNNTGATHR